MYVTSLGIGKLKKPWSVWWNLTDDHDICSVSIVFIK